MQFVRSLFATIFLLSLVSTPAFAQFPLLPVRQVFHSEYPAQYFGSVWQKENQFRAVIGYANACTIAMPDSFQWRSGQLNGMRISFDRVFQGDNRESVAVAIKSLKRTELKLFRIGENAGTQIIDAVTDTSFWEADIRFQIYYSITAIKSIGSDNTNVGLLAYSTMRDSHSYSGSIDRVWRLSGDLSWTYLNNDHQGGRVETGGITSLESLQLPGEALPRVYCGVTYESGNFQPRVGGQASMTCELVRFDLSSASELAFHTFATERNDQGIAPGRMNVMFVKAGIHPAYGAVVFAVYGRGAAEYLVLLDGNDLEVITSTLLPAENIAGKLANVIYLGNGNRDGADLLCVYKSGRILAATIDGEELLMANYSLDGIVIDATAGNFDNNGDLELAVTINRRLNIFELLPLAVSSPVILQPVGMELSVFPNPFNASATISYSLPRPGRYAIDVVDLQGRLVTRLADGWREAGSYRALWDAGQTASGTYRVMLRDNLSQSQFPVTLVK